MRARKQVYLGVERTYLIYSSSVNTLFLVFEPVSYDMLLNKVKNFLYLALAALKPLIKLLVNSVVYRKKRGVSYVLVVSVKRLLDVFNAEILDFLKDFRIGIV